MTLVLDRAPAPRRDGAGRPWRPAADRIHGRLAVAALCAASALCLVSPSAFGALQGWGGGLLLVGGALIGVPHGSSDFVVAHRLMRPALGPLLWLPCFLAGYLALVGVAMAGWALAPLATLLAFLAVSGLHFGAGPVAGAPHPRLLAAVRATTPVLPIFLFHPAGVAGLIAALAGTAEPATLHLLEALRTPLLPLWGAALAAVTLPPLAAGGRAGGRRALDAAELLAVALAAAALPPLVAFTLYFCLVHAVRHMLEIASESYPGRPRAAAGLAAAIVLPSALVCLAVLWFAWDGLAGALGTVDVVVWSLRAVAALTAPHMALEWLAARAR